MDELLREAERVHGEDPELADRYAELAWKLKLRHRVDLPERWKRFVCRRCRSFLAPGEGGRFRVRRGRLVVTCLDCGEIRRYVID